MHLGEISFCDRVGFNIKSDEIKHKILTELEAICGFKVIQKHHERFDPNNCGRLNTMPHLVSLRTNGNPYLLYLSKYNYENQCIFIDKKVQHGYFYPRMILSKLWFDPSVFDNTLLDGEMVKTTTGEWHFVINDIICLNNQVLEKRNIVQRVSILYDLLQNKYFDDEFNCCQLYVKKYFKLTELDQMLDLFLPSLPYTCRGVYFKPFYLKFRDVLMNFDDSLVHKVVRFKYKHIDGQTFKETPTATASAQHTHHTAQAVQLRQQTDANDTALPPPDPTTCNLSNLSDGITKAFFVKKTNNTDIYELYASCNDPKSHSVALVNSIKTSKLLKDLFRNLNGNEKIEMLCSYSEKFQKFCPKQPKEPIASSSG